MPLAPIAICKGLASGMQVTREAARECCMSGLRASRTSSEHDFLEALIRPIARRANWHW